MDEPYDIFRKESEGRTVWCGTASSLAEAHAKIRGLDVTSFEFLIVNEVTGEHTIVTSQPPLTKNA